MTHNQMYSDYWFLLAQRQDNLWVFKLSEFDEGF